MNTWPQWRPRLAKISAVLTAIILWQGVVRTPTKSLSGESLNSVPHPAAASSDAVLRVATFNIDSGVGADGKRNLPRTAGVIGRRDIVGLEEVHGGGLFGGPDEAEILGAQLHMPWLFCPSERRWWRDAFGNGILCDLPVTHWRRDRLSMTLSATNRTLLTCVVQWQNRPVTILVTHLDRGDDHDMELGAVLAAFRDAPSPSIILADLNTYPDSPILTPFRHNPAITDCIGAYVWPGNVDWILAKGFKCIASGFKDNDASDHRMAWADLALDAVR